MKQLILNIKESKYQFFMELIKSFDFVEIDEEATEDSKEEILANITEGLEELKLYKKGELKTTPAEDFLNEL